jgi:nitrogen regulatory protein PII
MATAAELVMLVIERGEKLNEVIAAWREAGVGSATVLDSVGMRQLGEQLTMDDVPLFPSLANLLRGDGAAQKTLFAVVREPAAVEELVERTKRVLGDLDEPGEGILFTLPVTRVVGLR